MKPSRIDFFVDVTYGVLLFLAIVLIVTVGTNVGIAFGLGALVSYIVHVVWKMARFDPQWMTETISESIEETLTEEVSETVEEQVTAEVTESVEEEVTESVGEQVAEEVTENVEETLSEEVDEIASKLDAVSERIDEKDSTEGGGSRSDEATGGADAEKEDEDR